MNLCGATSLLTWKAKIGHLGTDEVTYYSNGYTGEVEGWVKANALSVINRDSFWEDQPEGSYLIAIEIVEV